MATSFKHRDVLSQRQRIIAVRRASATQLSATNALPQQRRRAQLKAPESGPKLTYLTNYLPKDTFANLLRECAKLRGRAKRELHSMAENRLGCVVPRSSVITHTFSSQASRLSAILRRDELHLSEYPVEYRVYPVGAQMAWHVDDRLYEEPQYELIYTATNSSDSYTEWIDELGQHHKEWTQPNSLLIVQADGLNHRVTPVKKGERSILKMIMTSTDVKLPLFDEYFGRKSYK